MGLLDNWSYLQLFWSLMLVISSICVAQLLRTGQYYDVKQQMNSVNGSPGLFRFRKRLTLCYAVELTFLLWTLWNIMYAYCNGGEPGAYFRSFTDTMLSPRTTTTNSASVLFTMLLTFLHVFYRFYVTVYVSIFSQRQAYNVLLTALMYTMPVAIVLTLVAESPAFEIQELCLQPSALGLRHILGAIMLAAATKVHGDTHLALAKLRRNRFGHITTTEYKMPKGSLFEYVSCPHYLAEVVAGVSIAMMLGTSTAWLMAIAMTSNQVLLAYVTHSFYKTKFDVYPRDRKMIIPFLL